MIDKYTAQAPTTEVAIEKGLKALGLKIEQADIEVAEPGKKGFLGIGQKDAVVVVKRKQATSAIKSVFDSSFSSEDILPKDKPAPEKPLFVESETGTEPSSDQEIVEPVAESPEEVEETRNQSSDEKPLVMASTEDSEEAKPMISEEQQRETEQKDAEGIQQVAEYLKDVTNKMGIEDVSVHVQRQGKKVQYNIETEDAGLVIGRHGKVLNSLQTLAQIQLHQLADSKFFAKVDAEAYRDRRQKTVEQLAKRTADKVKHTKRPVVLEPMPAHERKLIHRFLNHHQGIQTHSEGKEPHRYLVVEPEK